MTALLRQKVSQALFSRLAARVFTTSSHVEAAATAASASKPALNKEFQIYRWEFVHGHALLAAGAFCSSAVALPKLSCR